MPVERTIREPTALRGSPSNEGQLIRILKTGEPFWLVGESIGWAWGYAGDERRVGYVTSETLN